ncbi:Clp1/GlmU family protein [Staphylothermus hellenicus]|uniref:polynucleotide 5'-hydroxyl-kinase n=1 Tax=Staphylothermus hellenicus (strain DSM 12710 / JCM 10830 / BK20S6-10-b1 / P8) TaxID=591019 RepID=D7DAX1_STAHD|nr:Clp1/GlmU family protein [Staphylothermus hellenicus]ADI31318.1 GTPase or GTP-binding protein-like protein [Staphylothermus hellenicus DSM 12710]
MPTVELRKDEAIKIFGPAAINIASGAVEVLGKKFNTNDKFIVHKTRSYIVVALTDSKLDVNLGSEASIQAVEEDDPYHEWVSIANEILSKGYRRIMILGGVDYGKSSFSTLLSNKALDNNLDPALIDADVGQADIGPPGFISMSYPTQQVIWMRMLKPFKLRFIGDIKPQHHIGLIIDKLKELINTAEKDHRKPIIIDTDGWIGDSYALMYKYRLVEEVKPDATIVIGEEYWEFFDKLSLLGTNIYKVKAPRIRKQRSREERRALRSDKYREFLVDSQIIKVSLKNVLITNMPLFMGKPISLDSLNVSPLEKVLYAAKTPDKLYLVLSEPVKLQGFDELKTRFNVQKIRTLISGFEKNLYVAIVDKNGDEYPGQVLKIDFRNETIHVRSKYRVEPSIIRFSHIRLTEEYTENILE